MVKRWFKVQAIVTTTVTIATTKADDEIEAVKLTEAAMNVPKVAEALVRANPGQCIVVECEHVFAEEMK